MSECADPIYEAHAGIAKSLQHTMSYFKGRRQELEEEMRQIDRQTRHISNAVAKGHWWELEGTLEEQEIELLSEVEPTDRLSLLNESWE